MAQRYKVRLGDGTVLSVDSDGLKTWAGDARATAQAIGSWRWQPLAQVLAEEEGSEPDEHLRMALHDAMVAANEA